MQAVKPGIYGIPWEQYLDIDALNNSTAKWLRKSAAHCLAARQGLMEKDTDAKRFGRILHTAIFEPKAYARVPIRPAEFKDWRSGAAQTWRAANPVHQTLDQVKQISNIVLSVRNHKEAKKLLAQDGKGEQTLVCRDADTGLLLKSRIDFLAPAVVDGKSTVDADPIEHGFPRQCALYGYHIQEAFYRRVMKNLKYPMTGFIFLAFEKEPPYAVTTVELDAMSVDKGAEEVDRLLWLYKDCVEKNEWPCYSDKVEPVTIPTWALRQKPFESAEGYVLEQAQ